MRPLQAFINLSLTCSLCVEGLKKKWLRIIRSVGKGGREARLSNFFSSSLPTPSPLPPSSISSHFLLPPSSTRKPVDRLNPYICSIEQEGQRRLTEVADDTVIRVTAGQERLVRQQAKLHASYDDVQRSISFSLRGNVRALHQERIMIDSGRKQLKEMAKTVLDKLGLFIWEFLIKERSFLQPHLVIVPLLLLRESLQLIILEYSDLHQKIQFWESIFYLIW